MLSSGQLLADRYKLTSRIAVGGMGEVWQASDTRLDRTVAVKILKAELSGDAEFLHRFRTEARMTASLNHPGIAAVHDYGETIFDGDLPIAYLVMELVDGDPLAGLLAKHGRLSAEFTLDMLEQAGNALQAAHSHGLVHRDVKPGNILVTSAGQVKITDFGVAKAADAAPVTRSGMVMGTAHYIAPEQALGQPAEPASDVYSLAVCGYECLAGHRPFLSENAVTVAMMHIRDIAPPLPPDVPPAARAVIEATLIKDPRQRYNNGGEFAAAVAAVRAGLPLPTPSGLVNATYATGQQPQQPPPQQLQPPPSMPVPIPQQQLPPQQQMPGGPPSPAMNPMLAIGPPSRPAPRQVMLPAARKKTQWGWWALLAAILLVVLVAGIVLVAKMLGAGNGSPPHNGQTQSQVFPGRQVPAEQSSGGYPADTPGTTTDDGRQGIMTTPWTEWNGIQR
ncbi:serine/threonine protein kinase [Amycolatopsis mediterranei S699]|uniref:non-specific serine/threonine protein kinase n=2 Tax=Amycolatopsis mediterranei TaxID=33910 RepID=A0A0H3CX20_AMYMU|nr:serine/threonine-protein kinase [Amycolatopsis mediterranei]ADJ41876.1 serine/threonine protein kinase [Amycolatopsis mediterranei U32]AEK38547.1 serine/threonine protein kinase [Amycolatopsis mediterranei S699]AFO73586.1 serine/threonine protein kinase [Amycolatopsis mediterranei S699]AGT80715.1 serine/threonine protein kinase [Amycolatopsis mediterranei RB]KDO09022.1 serine/threonine protein kinase [Amycolatopsis mediterranei]